LPTAHQASGLQHLFRKTRIKLTALFNKIQARDPTVFSAWEVLRMATIEGAQADLHVSVQAGDEVGSLEVGKQADLILVDLTELNLSPVLEAPVRNAGLLQQLLRALSLYELPPLV
jgi:5-methylthioadenosine/S-adenosylhomocysteine deaminase